MPGMPSKSSETSNAAIKQVQTAVAGSNLLPSTTLPSPSLPLKPSLTLMDVGAQHVRKRPPLQHHTLSAHCILYKLLTPFDDSVPTE